MRRREPLVLDLVTDEGARFRTTGVLTLGTGTHRPSARRRGAPGRDSPIIPPHAHGLDPLQRGDRMRASPPLRGEALRAGARLRQPVTPRLRGSYGIDAPYRWVFLAGLAVLYLVLAIVTGRKMFWLLVAFILALEAFHLDFTLRGKFVLWAGL